jgi:hypothetical protein
MSRFVFVAAMSLTWEFSQLFQPPLIALQAAMPLKDMAACTGAVRFIQHNMPRLLTVR